MEPLKLETSNEGEEILAYFFKDIQIKYEREKKIEGLKNDSKSYRVADFYLPRLKVYVEFLGMWNASKKNREAYIEKMRVYGKNRIPCIYIFPENLGILDDVFDTRLVSVLIRFGMKKQLRKYQRSGLWSILAPYIAITAIIAITIFTSLEQGLFVLWFLLSAFTFHQLWEFYKLKKKDDRDFEFRMWQAKNNPV